MLWNVDYERVHGTQNVETPTSTIILTYTQNITSSLHLQHDRVTMDTVQLKKTRLVMDITIT